MQKKIFLSFFIILLTGILICGFLFIKITQSNYNNNIEERIVANAYMVSELVSDKLAYHKEENINNYLKEIKPIVKMRITLVDTAGKVMGDTDFDIDHADNHHNRPEILKAIEGSIGLEKRFSSTLNENMLYCAVPVYGGEEVIAVIRLSSRMNEINILARHIYYSILISIAVGLAIATLMSYGLSINITKPIKEMTYMSSKISRGQFEKRIFVNSKDEIGELASSINHMASRLDETINSLKDKNVKMEAILISVVNGIIAVDNSENILFINPAAINILNIKEKDIVGRHILQVARNNELDEFLKGTIRDRKYAWTEMSLISNNFSDERILRVYTNPIKPADGDNIIGVIIVIQDITELRRLENMRTEFVANVSHELKTPLTSIKGFVETLKSGAMEDRKAASRFLDIIDDEADRLFRLINDILSLSELENKKAKANIESINIEYFINHILSIVSNQAEQKNICLKKEINLNNKIFNGNPDELKQLMINLVDNAIKYTPDKGTVIVDVYDENDALVLNVIDNGIGIPKEHIPRLFERFYRVDKARSKKIGGTGLGLAIVKHIVKSYNGEIEVESTPGEGTKFKVILPYRHSS